MLSNVLNDIRYALRTLRRNPGFALAAIVPIALGIGLNTAVFSIVNSVAWRSLPVPEPEALVSVYQDFRGAPRRTVYGARALFSMPEYRAYRDEARTLSGLMAYSREWTVTLGRESPREIDGILVTCNYFDVLGLSPAIGPGFTPANCGTPDAPPVVVLSHAFWKRAFGGDPNILQKPIVLNGRDVTVVGVAPAGFDGVDMAKEAFFAPTSMAGVLRPEQNLLNENAHVSWLTLIGRRRDDAIPRTGSDGPLDGRPSHRSGAVGAHDDADRGTGRRLVAARRAAGHPHGRGHCDGRVRARAARRRRQRRQHPARACGGSNPRDRDSSVGRRHTRPRHSAIADRKRHHRAGRRGVRLAALLVVVPGADSVAAHVGSGLGGLQTRRNAGSHGALVCAWTDGPDRGCVWTRSCAAGFERRRPRRDETGRRRRQRRAWMDSRNADRRTDRALHDAADPRGSPRACAPCRTQLRRWI